MRAERLESIFLTARSSSTKRPSSDSVRSGFCLGTRPSCLSLHHRPRLSRWGWSERLASPGHRTPCGRGARGSPFTGPARFRAPFGPPPAAAKPIAEPKPQPQPQPVPQPVPPPIPHARHPDCIQAEDCVGCSSDAIVEHIDNDFATYHKIALSTAAIEDDENDTYCWPCFVQ